MKLTIPQTTLKSALAAVSSILGCKTTLPILNHIRLTAHAGGLATFHTTNLDQYHIHEETVDVTRPGDLCLPAHIFTQIVATLPPGDITLESPNPHGGKPLTLTAGPSIYKFQTLPADEFPPLPEFPSAALHRAEALSVGGPPSNLNLSTPTFHRLLHTVAFAVSDDPTREVLRNILLAIDPSQSRIRSVATDGRRVALSTLHHDFPNRAEAPSAGGPTAPKLPAQAGHLLLPPLVVRALLRLLDPNADDASVKITFTDTRLRLQFHNTILWSNLVQGTFPAFDQVIPPTPTRQGFSIGVAELHRAASQIGRIHHICQLTGQGQTLTVSTSHSADDHASETLLMPSGHDFQKSYTAEYLIDALAAAPAGQLDLYPGPAPTDATVLRAPSALDWTYVLMPVREATPQA